MTLALSSIFLFSISTISSRDTLDFNSNSINLPKVADEHEDIDTMDINPSQRWNVTDESSRVTDTIIDSTYEILSNNNGSQDVNFEMNRKLRSLDSEVTMRSNMSYSTRSHEYFEDYELDQCDFDSMDDIDSYGATGDNITVDDGILQMRTFPSDPNWYIAWIIGTTIDASVYTTVNIRVKTNASVVMRMLWDHNGVYQVKEWYNLDTSSEWQILSYDLSQDSDWNNEHSHLDIYFYDSGYTAFEGDEFVWFDYVEFVSETVAFSSDLEYFRNEELDPCDFREGQEFSQSSSAWANVTESVVNGIYTVEMETLEGANSYHRRGETGLAINADRYDSLTVRIRVNDTSNGDPQFYMRDDSDARGWFTFTNTSWVTVDIDLTSAWAGTETEFWVGFRKSFSPGNLTYKFELDFVELTSAVASTVIISDWGLYNHNEDYYPLSIEYKGTDDLSLSVNLWNEDNSLAATYTTSSYALENEFVKYRLAFDLERSDFQLRMYWDNESRITTIDWPNDFTIIDNTPDLFASQVISVFYRVNTYNNSLIYNQIDYIEAEYKNREWQRYYNDDEVNLAFSSWDSAYLNSSVLSSTVSRTSWMLTVPKLDAVSFDMLHYVFLNTAPAGVVIASSTASFHLYNTNKTTGALTEFFRFSSLSQHLPTQTQMGYFNLLGTTYQQNSDFGDTDNSSVSISIATERDRQFISAKALYTDVEDDVNYQMIASSNITSYLSDYSDEFVLEFRLTWQKEFDMEYLMMVDNFAMIERDIFADIGNAIGGVINVGGDIFYGLASIFAAIFTPLITWLGGFLGAVFSGVGDVLSAGLTALGTLFTTAISALGTLLDEAIGAVEDVLDDVLIAIGNLADGIITALIDSLESIIDGLILIADVLYDLVDTILSEAISALGLGTLVSDIINLTDAVIGYVGDAIDLIIDTLAFLIDVIDLTLVLITPIILAYIFIGSATQASDGFDWVGRCIEKLNANLLPDISILGFTGNVKTYMIVIPGILLYV